MDTGVGSGGLQPCAQRRENGDFLSVMRTDIASLKSALNKVHPCAANERRSLAIYSVVRKNQGYPEPASVLLNRRSAMPMILTVLPCPDIVGHYGGKTKRGAEYRGWPLV